MAEIAGRSVASGAKVWTLRPPRPAAPDSGDEAERQLFVARCDALVRDVLRPRFLPEIRVSEQFNYCIDIRGSFRAGRYSFSQRYRSGFEDNRGEEFDRAFARIDRMGPDRFDIHWMRHTGKWWPLHRGVTLDRALHLMQTDGVIFPV